MKKIVIANCNNILSGVEKDLAVKYNAIVVKDKKDLILNKLDLINPAYIFFLHWSYIIPEEIYSKFNCIVFHMTDLPYGRGGSPLQNLVIRGHTETKISALKVKKGIDTGNIYLKKKLSLYGTAEEIFLRAGNVMSSMIEEIVETELSPIEQSGPIVKFERRKPEDSTITSLKTTNAIYDHIRMLDAEGYPHAFIETADFKFEFTRASLKSNNVIIADVRITKK
jgi:methionyl-tRNA formyltransferase